MTFRRRLLSRKQMNMLMSGYKEMSMLMLCALQRRSAHLSAPGAPVRLQMRRPLVRLLKKISSTPGRLRHQRSLFPKALVVILQRT